MSDFICRKTHGRHNTINATSALLCCCLTDNANRNFMFSWVVCRHEQCLSRLLLLFNSASASSTDLKREDRARVSKIGEEKHPPRIHGWKHFGEKQTGSSDQTFPGASEKWKGKNVYTPSIILASICDGIEGSQRFTPHSSDNKRVLIFTWCSDDAGRGNTIEICVLHVCVFVQRSQGSEGY